MSAFDGAVPEVLAAAVEAARKVLADMKADEVPAALRRAAAHHGGRLPPPLARRVVRELDRIEWFRARAAEVVGEVGDDASVAFLARPDGWWMTVAAAAAEQGARSERERVAELERRNRLVEGRLEEAKRRLKEAKTEAAAAATRAVRRVEELRARRPRLAGTGASGPEHRLEELGGRLGEERHARAEAEATVASLQEEVRRLRRERAAAERRLAAGSSSSLPSDPVELARFLDLQIAGLGRSAPPRLVVGGAAPRPRLPGGIAPDSGEAVRWLASLDAPVTVVVDGYNVLYQLQPVDPHGTGGRRRLEEDLRRWRRQSVASHRIVVVYDSTSPEARWGRNSVGGLEVRFAAEDRTADEEVVELAAVMDGPVVVISSDREVREAAEAAGALILWSEAFVGWIDGR